MRPKTVNFSEIDVKFILKGTRKFDHTRFKQR